MLPAAPVYPPKPRPGDRVAVVSPSGGLPELLPMPYELGLRRLREEFGLEVVEYPGTRRLRTTPRERAADLHAAFTDPSVKAVIASIGGDDQIAVLPELDGALVRAHPKPFFGYSDCTNLLAWLSTTAGLVGYHGISVMAELGRPGAMHPVTADSLRAALFDWGSYELAESRAYGDAELPWDDPETFTREPVMEPCDGWRWHRPDRVVEGLSWGGNLEVLAWMLMADREVRPVEEYAGRVLFLETSEEMPTATEVYRTLRSMGERGLLGQFPALLMGRAKTTSVFDRRGGRQRRAYREAQRAAVLRALAEYAPEAVAVFDVDLGHTDPQQVVPYGGTVRVDGPARRITVRY
ncbi:LD-carboxypeptidase [Streptomyces sp. N2-109]|uniref:LD-carboxypeptidase n=1 Tax=Streptomyces gossypii TaxID=2883101 RepID=A0ABT2K0Q0_9ACTN|nr:S66 peptidase family protein [Streptomyces gossypii]MCT2593209.1 LD-carboxypeptidase [Streptomyces gossypii]